MEEIMRNKKLFTTLIKVMFVSYENILMGWGIVHTYVHPLINICDSYSSM